MNKNILVKYKREARLYRVIEDPYFEDVNTLQEAQLKLEERIRNLTRKKNILTTLDKLKETGEAAEFITFKEIDFIPIIKNIENEIAESIELVNNLIGELNE